jgi:beta-fructofuranosidase
MTAWKEMWDRNFPTQIEGWAGTYILPRELRIEDGVFIQRPVREIEKYRGNKVTSGPVTISDGEFAVKGVRGTCAELSVTLEPGTGGKAGIKLFCGEEHETLIYYDKEAGKIIFDRSKSGIPFKGSEEDVDHRVCVVGKKDSIDLHVFLDINSIEVFIDGGRYVMSGNVYPDLGKDDEIYFFAEGGSCTFRELVKYDIEV